MRVLALSDIHAAVHLVERLRQRELNEYDLLIVAGDIGGRSARAICDILDTFECPVAYVFGNHDHELPYDFDLGHNGVHLDGQALVHDGIALVGFSGCPTHWGNNPIAARIHEAFEHEKTRTHAGILADLKSANQIPGSARDTALGKLRRKTAFRAYEQALAKVYRDILNENRLTLATLLRSAAVDNRYSLVVTHERLTFPGLLPQADCFLHGHNHKFEHVVSRGKLRLNVAALDKPLTVYPADTSSVPHEFCIMDTGNYVTFEICGREMRNLTLKRFGWRADGWVRSEGISVVGDSYRRVGADPTQDTEMIVGVT